MTVDNLITIRHLERRALIYVRQSTPQQVLTHQESLRLQYALHQRAQELGWPASRIEIIDTDLGLSAAAASHRSGFQALVAQVTLGQVGIILSIDVTRLSRNCSDWYPLLDLCGFKQCLIGDRDGVYDPGTTNGRLLLGLKGQISELELRTIRLRLTTGLLQKAQRGELVQKLPVGLERDELNRVMKDPNLEVQHRIELVFEIFLEVGAACRTVKQLQALGLALPRRNAAGDVVWKRATVEAVLAILHNPAYAGVFVYGRSRQVRPDLSRRPWHRPLPISEWNIQVAGKYPAYIDWSTYERIQQMLTENRAEYSRRATPGIARNGQALLQGVAWCGECGHKLCLTYRPIPHYCCVALHHRYGDPMCQRIAAQVVDGSVVQAFFEALSPAELNLYEEVMAGERVSAEQAAQAQAQQLQRLEYQARLAEQQFCRVDPENRLVAAELERRWETALRAVKAAGALTEPTPVQDQPLTPDLKAALLDLGQKLPELWNTGWLTLAQKKKLIRCLIEKVVLQRQPRDRVQVRLVWRGGAVTEWNLPLPVGSFSDLPNASQLEQRVLELVRTGASDQAIAHQLTGEGFRSPRHSILLESTVRRLRLQHRLLINRHHPQPGRPANSWSVSDVTTQLRLPPHWIYYQIQCGRLQIPRDPDTGLYFLPAHSSTLEQLEQLKNGFVQTVYF